MKNLSREDEDKASDDKNHKEYMQQKNCIGGQQKDERRIHLCHIMVVRVTPLNDQIKSFGRRIVP